MTPPIGPGQRYIFQPYERTRNTEQPPDTPIYRG